MRQVRPRIFTFTIATRQVVRIRTRDIVSINSIADPTWLFSLASLFIRPTLDAVIHLLQNLAFELGQNLVIPRLIGVSHGCALGSHIRSGILAILEDLQADCSVTLA